MTDCPFCHPVIDSQVVLTNELCYSIWTRDTPLGSTMILPHAHRPTVFDLTEAEWAATRGLLHEMKALLAERHQPAGWNVGWNVEQVGGQSVMHAHVHLIPRYADEPLAGRGLRYWLRDPTNRPERHGDALA